VSEFADISPSHISRVFQKQYGMGVHDYIQSIRVNHASGLLRSGLVVNEIAKKSGFTSVASMNRAFKKFRGITPAKMNSAQEFKPSVMPESGA
jgi:two-component system response regulator YesN